MFMIVTLCNVFFLLPSFVVCFSSCSYFTNSLSIFLSFLARHEFALSSWLLPFSRSSLVGTGFAFLFFLLFFFSSLSLVATVVSSTFCADHFLKILQFYFRATFSKINFTLSLKFLCAEDSSQNTFAFSLYFKESISSMILKFSLS